MAEHSTIEWTDATWNPITGCSVISPGCTNCYAMKLAGGRMQRHPSRQGLTTPSKAGPVWNGEIRRNEDWIRLPIAWTRGRLIFACAHSDLFHDAVPDAWIDEIFGVMVLARQHIYQLLTKRPARMRRWLERLTQLVVAWHQEMADGGDGEAFNALSAGFPHVAHALFKLTRRPGRHWQDWPMSHLWLGTSAEDQERANERLPHLMATPAAVRFLSAEPLLSDLDIRWALTRFWPSMAAGFLQRGHFSPGAETLRPLDWVIAGGESGRDARPVDPRWVRNIRDQCRAAGTPFFFKQWGEWWPQECHPAGSFAEVLEVAGIKPSPALPRGCWGADNVWRPGGVAGGPPAYTSWRVGKKAAGRRLDGVEHNAMPEVRHG